MHISESLDIYRGGFALNEKFNVLKPPVGVKSDVNTTNDELNVTCSSKK